MNTPSHSQTVKVEVNDNNSETNYSEFSEETTVDTDLESLCSSDTDEFSDSEPSDSTREMQKFYKRTFHPHSRSQGNNLLTLDPIKKELVGQLRVKVLLDACLAVGSPEWSRDIRGIFDSGSAVDWCGRVEKVNGIPKVLLTQKKFKEAVKILSEGVLEPISNKAFYAERNRSYVTIFLVPKDAGKARAIGNCKIMNESFKKSPRLTFAMMEDIFRIVTFFGWQAFFATADFRHWFYQIPLPTFARHFFTVKCGKLLRQFTVWPMGFAWSPFVAQGISMLIAWLAIWRCGDLEAISPMGSQSEIPPVWIIKKRASKATTNGNRPQSKADILGFIIFWYDNLLLVTNKEKLRQRILDKILETSTHCHALWKSSTSEIVQDTSAFVTSSGHVEYLGVRFRFDRNEKGYVWEHVDKNIVRWTTRAAKLVKAPSLSWKDVSFLAGVLTWHWTISGEEKEKLGIALQIAHRLGEANIDDKSWNKQITDLSEWSPIIQMACDKIQGLQNGPYKRVLEAVEPFERTIFLASDASNDRGAWVELTELTVESRVFNKAEKTMHINWKETWWALRALEVALKNCEGRSLIKIGVDNMTAVCALKQKVVGFNQQLDRAMHQLAQMYKAKQCKWVVHHIAGDAQPADEPSRGLELDAKKVEEARMYLSNKPDAWFHWKNESKVAAKRERDENEVL